MAFPKWLSTCSKLKKTPTFVQACIISLRQGALCSTAPSTLYTPPPWCGLIKLSPFSRSILDFIYATQNNVTEGLELKSGSDIIAEMNAFLTLLSLYPGSRRSEWRYNKRDYPVSKSREDNAVFCCLFHLTFILPRLKNNNNINISFTRVVG